MNIFDTYAQKLRLFNLHNPKCGKLEKNMAKYAQIGRETV
jgi:hypothetical protein